MTLTIGTNTYTTVAEADAYFALTLKAAAWTALDGPTKEITLRMACRKLDRELYTGVKTTDSQLLEFPRDYGRLSSTIPDDVKAAQAELALYLYQNQNNQVLAAQQMGLKSLSLGNESYTFSDKAGANAVGCPEAYELLNKWLRKGFALC